MSGDKDRFATELLDVWFNPSVYMSLPVLPQPLNPRIVGEIKSLVFDECYFGPPDVC
jgi:hypothetical protein